MSTLNERKQHGPLSIEKASNGRWVWIEDADGTLWCEVDGGCDLTAVPEHLRAAVQSAYEWSTEENRLIAEDESREMGTTRQDEIDEWNSEYYNTRGIK